MSTPRTPAPAAIPTDATLNVNVTGGWFNPDATALTEWTVTTTLEYVDSNGVRHSRPVSSADLVVANPVGGNIRLDADITDPAGDLGALTSHLYDRFNVRAPAFAATACDGTGSTLIIEYFEVDPAYRGTALVQVAALRTFYPFAMLGIDAAALLAAPAAEDLDEVTRKNIAGRLADSWKASGFDVFAEEPGGYVMAMPLTVDHLDHHLSAAASLDSALEPFVPNLITVG